jgi:hypothetical protein
MDQHPFDDGTAALHLGRPDHGRDMLVGLQADPAPASGRAAGGTLFANSVSRLRPDKGVKELIGLLETGVRTNPYLYVGPNQFGPSVTSSD